ASMPAPGEGKVDCQLIAGRVQQTLSSAYPLKLMSPQAVPNADPSQGTSELQPAVCYILSYGGGIVHGDQIHVDVRAGTGCALMLLTQGSTKVYRHRAGRPPSCLKNTRMNENLDINQTYQTLLVDVEPRALVCLLPDPVTCFKGALYNQRQAVRLHDTTSSLVLLDWMTSGRMSRGERWAFEKYLSVNVV
ncbi:UreD-domain-containing protein, partial [Martensiomyces pterosporus]